MIYNSLTPELQNLLVYNHENTIKFFIIVVLLLVSVIYLFNIRKRYEQTDSIFTALYRVILSLVSKMYLYAFPLLYIFFMHPAYSYSNLLIWTILSYSVCLTLFTMTLIYRYAVVIPLSIIKDGLLNPDKVNSKLLKELKLK